MPKRLFFWGGGRFLGKIWYGTLLKTKSTVNFGLLRRVVLGEIYQFVCVLYGDYRNFTKVTLNRSVATELQEVRTDFEICSVPFFRFFCSVLCTRLFCTKKNYLPETRKGSEQKLKLSSAEKLQKTISKSEGPCSKVRVPAIIFLKKFPW